DHGLCNPDGFPRKPLSFVHFMLPRAAFKSLFGSSFCGGSIAKELFAISAIGRIADKIELVVFDDIKPVIPDDDVAILIRFHIIGSCANNDFISIETQLPIINEPVKQNADYDLTVGEVNASLLSLTPAH